MIELNKVYDGQNGNKRLVLGQYVGGKKKQHIRLKVRDLKSNQEFTISLTNFEKWIK